MISRRIRHVLVALDQFVYVLITLGRSERAGKLGGRIFRPVIDWLFSPLMADHCRKAYLAEIRRLQSHPMMRHGDE